MNRLQKKQLRDIKTKIWEAKKFHDSNVERHDEGKELFGFDITLSLIHI